MSNKDYNKCLPCFLSVLPLRIKNYHSYFLLTDKNYLKNIQDNINTTEINDKDFVKKINTMTNEDIVSLMKETPDDISKNIFFYGCNSFQSLILSMHSQGYFMDYYKRGYILMKNKFGDYKDNFLNVIKKHNKNFFDFSSNKNTEDLWRKLDFNKRKKEELFKIRKVFSDNVYDLLLTYNFNKDFNLNRMISDCIRSSPGLQNDVMLYRYSRYPLDDYKINDYLFSPLPLSTSCIKDNIWFQKMIDEKQNDRKIYCSVFHLDVGASSIVTNIVHDSKSNLNEYEHIISPNILFKETNNKNYTLKLDGGDINIIENHYKYLWKMLPYKWCSNCIISKLNYTNNYKEKQYNLESFSFLFKLYLLHINITINNDQKNSNKLISEEKLKTEINNILQKSNESNYLNSLYSFYGK